MTQKPLNHCDVVVYERSPIKCEVTTSSQRGHVCSVLDALRNCWILLSSSRCFAQWDDVTEGGALAIAYIGIPSSRSYSLKTSYALSIQTLGLGAILLCLGLRLASNKRPTTGPFRLCSH